MIWALLGLLVLLLGAAWYIYVQGKKLAEAQAELVEKRRHLISQQRLIEAMGQAMEAGEEIEKIAERSKSATSTADLNQLWEEIAAKIPRP